MKPGCIYEDKICGGGGVVFECKVSNITKRRCYDITLNNEEYKYTGKQFAVCICINCIKLLRTEYNTKKFATQNKNNFGHYI